MSSKPWSPVFHGSGCPDWINCQFSGRTWGHALTNLFKYYECQTQRHNENQILSMFGELRETERKREMETKGERERLVQGCILNRKQLFFCHHLRKTVVKFGEIDFNLPFLLCPLYRPYPLCLHATSTVHLD